MNRTTLLGGLCAAFALTLAAAPGSASASCSDRKATGTVLGGIGGALIGNSIARGGGGAIVGGLGGAVVGHEIAGSGCRSYRHYGYRDDRSRRGYYSGPQAYADRPRQTVYYDSRGQAISPSGGAGYAPVSYGYGRSPACATTNQAYFDARGSLIQQPVQSCR